MTPTLASAGKLRVCILTPGQPSNNPRFVKEADALVEAGYTVHAICTDCGLWPSHMDAGVMAQRRWTVEYAGGEAVDHPLRHKRMRIRQHCSCRMLNWKPASPLLQRLAIARAVPELTAAAMKQPADLYIAHHPSVLPVAVQAARRHGALVGYDIEDVYSEMYPNGSKPSEIDLLIERIEAKYLPACSYVTAASPAFAAAYVQRYGIRSPSVVLNVFPRSQRPREWPQRTNHSDPLRLYWFSQCIGADRGLEDVVQALGLLRHCAIEFHVRGAWQTGYQERLLQLARSCGVAPSRIVAHAPAAPDVMVSLAAQYDVGLALEPELSLNSRLCLSNKIFTYFLAGSAVIGTETPGQLQVLERAGNAALSYRAGDVSALARNINSWFEDRECLLEARRHAWQLGEREYNWDIQGKKFVSLISELWQATDVPYRALAAAL